MGEENFVNCSLLAKNTEVNPSRKSQTIFYLVCMLLSTCSAYCRPPKLPVAPDWWSLGIQLGLPLDQLHSIQYNNVQYPDSCNRCLTDMFDWWLKGDYDSTYENLATALGAIGIRDLTLEVCRENSKWVIKVSCKNLAPSTYIKSSSNCLVYAIF